MAFNKGAYFEKLRQEGKFNPNTRVGLHPTGSVSSAGIMPAAPKPLAGAMPVNNTMPLSQGAPPMPPMASNGQPKFAKLKKYF